MPRGRPTAEMARLRDSAEEMMAETLAIADAASVLRVRLADLLDTLDYGRERPVERAPLASIVDARRNRQVLPLDAA